MQDKLLIALMEQFDKSAITELDYSDGAARLLLRKGGSAAPVSHAAPPPAHSPPPSSGAPVLSQDEVDQVLKKGGAPNAKLEAITAPIVATFYASPGPDSPPFVEKGALIKKGQILCILEAMKMMNNFEADFDGKIVDIKAKSGDLVEFGQVLFEVERV